MRLPEPARLLDLTVHLELRRATDRSPRLCTAWAAPPVRPRCCARSCATPGPPRRSRCRSASRASGCGCADSGPAPHPAPLPEPAEKVPLPMSHDTSPTAHRHRLDPGRWPDVARVPAAALRAPLARTLLRQVAAPARPRVELPDGAHHRRAPAARRIDDPAAAPGRASSRRLGAGGLIGFGEAYLAGDWDSDDLVGLLTVLAGVDGHPGAAAPCSGCAAGTPCTGRADERNTPEGARAQHRSGTTTCPTTCSRSSSTRR